MPQISEEYLINLAIVAFKKISENQGISYLGESPTLQSCIDAFNKAIKDLGLAGLINAATGSGLSHLGLSYWFQEAKKLIGE